MIYPQLLCGILLGVLSSLLHLSISLSFTLKTVLLALFLGIVVPVAAAVPSIRSMLQEVDQNARSDGNQVIEYKIVTSSSTPMLPSLVVFISLLMAVCGMNQKGCMI